jgi:membrane fusion protein (multidrug efflux system)
MIKRLVLAIVLLALVVGGIVGFNLFRSRMISDFFAGQQPPPVTVSVIEAEPLTWRPGIEAIGTARAAQGVDLAVEAAGVVEEVLFNANERVEAGELLLQIDDTIEQADLAAARAALELAESELERFQTLRQRGITPTTNVDTAQAAATEARSQVVKLTAILEQKALKAPFDGIIGIPRVDVGGYVIPGTVYATLQDLETMRVDFSVPEQQIRLIEIGMPVTASSEVGEVELTGQVIGIDPKIDPNTRLVNIRAEVENPDGEINPGQFLRVRVELPEEEDIIALPQTAVSSNLYGDSVYVVRAPEVGEEDGQEGNEPARVEQVFVRIGRRSLGLVEIIEGVEPGERVVTAGQNRLSSGSPVTIDNSVDPALATTALD